MSGVPLALPLFRRGKVRDTFHLSDGTLLMVASDRISAFDVVLPTLIPGKGAVLTAMSRWWFERTAAIVPNHVLSDAPELVGERAADIADRAMRVVRADRIDIECVVRGHLSGSAWTEYRNHGTVAGEALPAGLTESATLPEPLFTPATKADTGHDQNISRRELESIVGRERASELETASLRLFRHAAEHCAGRGIIVADTKFEFGLVDGELILIDELLTPDSSRFWLAETWRAGGPVPSFDKQFVRDYLNGLGWDRTPPAPDLPSEVVAGTVTRYREAAARITAPA